MAGAGDLADDFLDEAIRHAWENVHYPVYVYAEEQVGGAWEPLGDHHIEDDDYLHLDTMYGQEDSPTVHNRVLAALGGVSSRWFPPTEDVPPNIPAEWLSEPPPDASDVIKAVWQQDCSGHGVCVRFSDVAAYDWDRHVPGCSSIHRTVEFLQDLATDPGNVRLFIIETQN